MPSEISLSVDLRLLAYSALLCLVLWIPYILAAMRVRGLGRVAGYPTGDYQDLPDSARRSHLAHQNLVENLVPFAALVLVAHLAGAANETTALGARLFFWARLGQAVFHVAAVPWLRTVAFLASWVGSLIIFWQIVY